jgi:hypothetical protein
VLYDSARPDLHNLKNIYNYFIKKMKIMLILPKIASSKLLPENVMEMH